MSISKSMPLRIRMLISRVRAIRSPADLFGRHFVAGMDAYVASDVESNRWRQIAIGKGTQVHRGILLHCNDNRIGKSITLGDRAFIGQYCFFSAGSQIEIGQDCLIGSSCSFLGAGHSYQNPTIPYAQAEVISYGEIVLGPNVWMGAHSIVMGNVSVGFGSIIAAGTMLRKSVPPLCMVAGSPSRIIKVFDWKFRVWRSFPIEAEFQNDAIENHISSLPTLSEFTNHINHGNSYRGY